MKTPRPLEQQGKQPDSATAGGSSNNRTGGETRFVDHRASSAAQRKPLVAIEHGAPEFYQKARADMISNSTRVKRQTAQMAMIQNSPRMVVQHNNHIDAPFGTAEQGRPCHLWPGQRAAPPSTGSAQGALPTIEPKQSPEKCTDRPNNTGIPDRLKSGIETLSGVSLDHVQVHYNSSEPAQLHALAYAQGSDIFLGPGQEEHLPHEAWHVVQQVQGRVNPTRQLDQGVSINDDAGLEHEAELMGNKSLSTKPYSASTSLNPARGSPGTISVTQCQVDINSKNRFSKGVMSITLTPSLPSVKAVINYRPNRNANNADPIRLIQIVKASNSGTPTDWTRTPERRRHKTMTLESREAGVEAGWFVDHSAKHATPRTHPHDEHVPDAYIDASKVDLEETNLPRAAADGSEAVSRPKSMSFADLATKHAANVSTPTPVNQHGRKQGKQITPATLTDFPESSAAYEFKAEVIVKGTEKLKQNVDGETHELLYGSATWEFSTETDEHGGQKMKTYSARFRDAPSPNFGAAVDKYNEVYRNRSAKTAPEKVAALKEKLEEAATTANHEQWRSLKEQYDALDALLEENATDEDFSALDSKFGLPDFDQSRKPRVEHKWLDPDGEQGDDEEKEDWGDFLSARP
ncbi:protein of unknown function [Duganella sp. CF517]|uniref:eCIS core domain-containing protein n=1 Tax=Duganella sp. CF517 TaxID=1881038 RepID=UPI0008AE8298|nr:DUF4157 domain-containing protein [Duganella sp. CF517]SEN07451.1 protein of unknown function [Duganella sp. CF517]